LKVYGLALVIEPMAIRIDVMTPSTLLDMLLICLIAVLTIVIIKQNTIRKKTEKEYQNTQKSLKESLIELESANLQLIASEDELNRQFLEIREQKDKLRISRERYRLAAEGAEVGIWDIDFVNGEVYVSKKGKEVFGLDESLPSSITYTTIKEKILDSDFPDVKEKYFAHIKNITEAFEVKCRIQVCKDKYSWIYIRGRGLRNKEGQVTRMAGSVSNINKEKINEARIRKLAYYDSLTDLPNRAYFNQLMDEYIQNKVYDKFAVFLIDIDNFKAINDSLGHSYGDEIIIRVASHLKKHLNKDSELIRFGGDEFLIIVHDIKTNGELKAFAEIIVDEFNKPFINDGLMFPITLSMGVATYPFDGEQADELLKHADMALYDVKMNGKNGYKMFSFELDESFNKRITLERDLRKAINNMEFELYYQPKLDVEKGKVIGYEALLRWHHPDKGIVSPLEFIPLAEETGLIIPIGEWVICESIKQLKEWDRQGHSDLSIAINLSARQFRDVHLLDLFKRIYDEMDVDMSRLELEITESTALEDIKFAVNILKHLKSLGIKLSLDDFGTGYSSLNYLTQLPIDYLKIDKSFLNHTIKHRSGEEIIKSVINLAHACNIKVIAEGVETKEQMDFLINEACDMIQGYYISQPVPIEEALKFLSMNY